MKRAWRFALVACLVVAFGGSARSEVTPGYEFLADANQDIDGDSVWEDLTVGNPSGLELLLDDSPAVSRIPVSSSTRITSAYDFTGGSTNNEAGALLVQAGTTNAASFSDAPGDWSTNAVSLEIWFRPDVIDPTPTNGYLLFEDGGGSGLGLFIVSNKLVLSQDYDEAQISYDLATDPSSVLLGPATSEFMQAVVVRDNQSPFLTKLYINAVSVGTSNDDDSDWSGGDDVGFGTRGGANTGGRGNGQTGTESFDGQIALIRIYDSQLLTAEQVTNNFLSVTDPDTAGPVIIETTPQDDSTGASVVGNLEVAFDEAILLVNGGSVTIRNMTTASNEVISIPSAQLSTDASTLIIDPAADFDYETSYAVQISASAVTDVYTNYFAGITDYTNWNFTTGPAQETVTWDGATSGDAIWTEPDGNSWSGGTYDSGDTVQFLGAGSGTVTIDAGGVTPGSNVIVNSSASYTFAGGSIGGSCGLIKSGSGTLSLNSLNTFTGDIIVLQGRLAEVTASALGSSPLLHYMGSGNLKSPYNGAALSQEVRVDSGATLTLEFASTKFVIAFNGPVSGAGTITVSGSSINSVELKLQNAGNTFTGTLVNPGQYAGIVVNSLGDGGRINMNKGYFSLVGSGTQGPFRTRQVEMSGTSSVAVNNNSSPSKTLLINTDLLVSASGNKTLTLGGSNTGTNTFAGAITNGVGAVVSITKVDGGKWILAGANTYSGTTTVSGGTLVLRGEQAIIDTGTLNIISGKVQIDTREKIGVLKYSGTTQLSGTYGSSASGAEHPDDTRFTGTERLYVGVDFPPSGSVIIVK